MADLAVFRIASSKYPAPDGEGAYRAGGRWNLKGTRVVYTSGHISLALVELLVHLDYAHMPDDRVLIRATIPRAVDIETVPEPALPSDWRDYPAPYSTQSFGTQWVREARTAVLGVPSVVIDRERNYILNPAHPDFARIRFAAPEPFSIDPRL